jgi:2-(1,2-epoxy-1,2-dihydrophenyl)acetyl-CoA isomerase
MADETVQMDFSEGVLTVTLDRPKANAFNREMIAATRAAIQQAGSDDRVRCVVLTGRGQIFSAGQDISEVQGGSPISYQAHLEQTYHPLVLEIRRLEKPVLAAVNGAVAGAALGVVLACDLRVAADTARFTVGFLRIGLVPDSAVSCLLPAIIGLGRAAEATYLNRPIEAEEAFAWGLVNRVAPFGDLSAEVQAWGKEIARGPAGALGLAKRSFNFAVLPRLEAVLDHEAALQDIAGRSEDHQEGVQAFLDKRPPEFI